MRTECTEAACNHGVIGGHRGHGEAEQCFECEGTGYLYYCDNQCKDDPIPEEEHENNQGLCKSCQQKEDNE